MQLAKKTTFLKILATLFSVVKEDDANDVAIHN